MPKKGNTGHYAHQVDEHNSREFYVAFTLGNIGIEFIEELHEPAFIDEVEELIKEPGFTKAIDLRDIFTLSKVFGNACLVSVSGAPAQTFSDFL
jgi:ABC-type microcin C transport system permease subunit YejB